MHKIMNTIPFTTKLSKLTSAIAISALMFSSMSLQAFAANRTIDFSGYTWTVKSGFNGPGPNTFDDSTASVFLDSSNQLHLKVSNIGGKWYSSEAYLQSSLGYGTYEWETNSRVDKIDTNLVLGLFMYQDDTHEIDIEYSNWMEAAANMLNYTVQPYTIKSNTYTAPLSLQDGVSTHKIEWTPDYILFSTWQNGQKLNEWKYTGSNNFVPGRERVDMNFWMIKGLAPAAGTDQELIIKSFKFTPVSVTPPALVPVVTADTTTTTTSSTVIAPVTTTSTVTPDTTTVTTATITSPTISTTTVTSSTSPAPTLSTVDTKENRHRNILRKFKEKMRKISGK